MAHHNYWVFEGLVERVPFARRDKISGARVFVSDMGKRINVGFQRRRWPLKPPDGACGDGRRRSQHVFNGAPLRVARTQAAPHHALRL